MHLYFYTLYFTLHSIQLVHLFKDAIKLLKRPIIGIVTLKQIKIFPNIGVNVIALFSINLSVQPSLIGNNFLCVFVA